jgi:maleylacetate reductase
VHHTAKEKDHPMHPFVYTALPTRVVFGSGTLVRLNDELKALGCSRALVLSTSFQESQANEIANRLGSLSAGVFSGAAMHTPVDITERALEIMASIGADSVISVGGGSTTGLGKAIALRTDLPQIVIPTTYAGSEATPILGETINGRKTTQRTPKVLPEVILYDVDLTFTLPGPLSVTSGINAIAHAAEALYAANTNPIISILAEQGIAALVRALPRILSAPEDLSARSDALFGAWTCGVCLGSVDMALHHKLCHTLGGAFNLPHAETHTILLPHTLAYNKAAAPNAARRIAAAIGVDSAPRGLFELIGQLGAPRALKEIGMPREGIEYASDLATSNPYPNPEPVTRVGIHDLLERAFDGQPPVEAKEIGYA